MCILTSHFCVGCILFGNGLLCRIPKIDDAILIAMILLSGMTDADSFEVLESESVAFAEAGLRSCLAGSYDAVALIDGNGNLGFVSESVHELLGYPAQHLHGTAAASLIHPDERADVVAALNGIRVSGSLARGARATRILHCDGSWREIELLGVRSTEDSGFHGCVVVGLRALNDRRVPDRVIAADNVLFRRLATISGDLTLIVSAELGPIYVSPSITSMLGHSVETVLALPIAELFSSADRIAVVDALTEAQNNPGVAMRIEVRARSCDDSARWVDLTIVNLLDDMMVRGIVLHARDIHERRCIEEELRFRAHHDPLTGLPNRYCFVELLTANPTLERTDRSTAVIFCDLDRFKEINDKFGHLAGDEILCETARRLRTAVRPGDLIARIGGDEFCIVCEGLTNVREALEIAERIRFAVAEPTRVGEDDLVVGVSVGVAWSGGESIDGESLLRIADRAMYAAKTSGRNRVRLAAA
jgi:diguanylate cyclase (GGDEF)-like protein/PAS domain S-box-containing protein